MRYRKTAKRVLIILLIMALTYANFITVGEHMIRGAISYAVENQDATEPTDSEDNTVKEEENSTLEENKQVELAVDRDVLSATQENNVVFTITLNDTEDTKFINPKFEIQLPECIKSIKLKETSIVEKRGLKLAESKLDERKIVINLEGEQEEGDVPTQIVIKTVLASDRLIPTTESEIKLSVNNNENKTEDTIKVTFATEEAVILANTLKINDEKVVVIKDENQEIKIEESEEEISLKVTGTIINNTSVDLKETYVVLANGEKKEIGDIAQNSKKTFTYTINVLPEEKEKEISYKFFVGEEETNSPVIKLTKIPKPVEIKTSSKININSEYIENAEINSTVFYYIEAMNTTEQKIENVAVSFKIPEGLKYIDTNLYEYDEENDMYSRIEIKEINEEKNEVTVKFDLNEKQNTALVIEAKMTKYITEEITADVKVEYENEEVKSTVEKQITNKTNKPAKLEVTVTSDKENEKLQEGDKINYTITVKNVGQSSTIVNIESLLPGNITINKVKYVLNGKTISETVMTGTDVEVTGNVLNENDELKIIINATVNKITENEQIINNVTVTGENVDKVTEEIANDTIVKEDDGQDDDKEDEDKDNDDKQDEDNNTEEQKYKISGVAWFDKNGNGQRDNSEDLLKEIKVILTNAKTGEKISNTLTDFNGKYEFSNLDEGSYIVVFEYSKNKYSVTNYQKPGVDSNVNSDAITTTTQGQATTKTETITITNADVKDIDIGLVINKIFDLSIEKNIKKITVQNKSGKTEYDYKNSNFAKIEIPAKYYEGSKLTIEYEITVKNDGSAPAYVKSIVDYIPEGLKFSSELNESWYEGTDGNLYCVELASDLLDAGETRTIKLVLTKQIEDDAAINLTNTAEIEDYFNEYALEDRDSIPGNKDESEDDLSKAELIVTIKTGKPQTYIGLVLACIAIIGGGIFLINKKILSKYQIM